jgi:uncharacterized membrane protein
MKKKANEVIPQKTAQHPERIFELDFVRGILIIAMIWEHIYTDWTFYFDELNWQLIPTFNIINNIIGGSFTNKIMNWWYPFNDFGVMCFFTMQGITFTFSRKNKKRLTGLLIGFMIYYAFFLLEAISLDIRFFSFLTFEVFFAYAMCMLIFMLISKFSFKIQLWISALLCMASVFFIYIFDTNFTFNPLHWFELIDKLVFYRELKFKVYKVYVFPAIFIYSCGTIIGQLYYKNRTSPFALYNLNHKKIFKPILWCGRYSLRIFLAHMILLPLIFFTLYLIF